MSNIIQINYALTATSASIATRAISASYTDTASYALNGGGSINTSSLATTGSNAFIGNQTITGSINTTGSSTIIGNLVVKSTPSETYLTIDTNYYQLNIPSTTFNSGASVDWYNRLLYRSSLATPVLDWNSGILLDPGNNYSVYWDNRQLYDAGFPSSVLSVDWGGRYLYDTSGAAISLDWSSRTLNDTSNFITIDWGNRQLYDAGFPSPALSMDWGGRTLYDSFGIASIDWNNRTLNDGFGNSILNYSGGGNITFTGTSSYATYAETASYIIGGATTGSNTFIGNQNILDNYLYITSSTSTRFAELGNEYISFYDDVSNTGDRYSYVGFDGISLVSGSYNRLDIAVNANTFGSSWAGSVFQVRNNLNNPVDVIKLENYNNWTDGKITFETPISASAGITASSVSINNILTLTPQDPLPTSPAGTIAVSASTPPVPYFYDGSTWNALY